MFGNRRLLFKLDPDTPSINKCTGEIDVMEAIVEMTDTGTVAYALGPSINKCTGEIDVIEALVEMILTLVYSLIWAPVEVHRWIQAPVHMHQWRFNI